MAIKRKKEFGDSKTTKKRVFQSKLSKVLAVSVVSLVLLLSAEAYAIYSRMQIEPGVGILLPAYNATIDADNSMFMNQWQWNQENATSVTFSTLFMDAGPAIPILTVESTDNMTFSVLKNTEISYSAIVNSTQTFSTVNEPTNVTIDGVDKPYAWVYHSGALTVTTEGNATIIFSSISGLLTTDDVLGVAIVLFAVAVCVCIALIYRSKSRGEE